MVGAILSSGVDQYLVGGFGHFLISFAMMISTGAQGEMPLSFAISATSHGVTPTRLWALSMRKARRSLGRSLAAISTLGGMSVRVGREGALAGFLGCGLVGTPRPVRVVARRVFAARI
jgi:hypothetical protein